MLLLFHFFSHTLHKRHSMTLSVERIGSKARPQLSNPKTHSPRINRSVPLWPGKRWCIKHAKPAFDSYRVRLRIATTWSEIDERWCNTTHHQQHCLLASERAEPDKIY